MVAGLVLALLSASTRCTDRGSSTTVGLIRVLDELLACRRVGRGGLMGRGGLVGRGVGLGGGSVLSGAGSGARYAAAAMAYAARSVPASALASARPELR